MKKEPDYFYYVFAVILFFFFSVAADWKSVLNCIAHFNLLLIPVLLYFLLEIILSGLWNGIINLRLLQIKIDRKLSFRIFLSDWQWAASPAKTGEVLKSLLLKETINETCFQNSPYHFCREINWFFSLTFLSLVGALSLSLCCNLVYAVLFFFVITIFILKQPSYSWIYYSQINSYSRLKNQLSRIETLYESGQYITSTETSFIDAGCKCNILVFRMFWFLYYS